MSEWLNANDEDIEIDKVGNEVNIYVKSDDWGSIYLCINFQQIRNIYALMNDIEEGGVKKDYD